MDIYARIKFLIPNTCNPIIGKMYAKDFGKADCIITNVIYVDHPTISKFIIKLIIILVKNILMTYVYCAENAIRKRTNF